MISAEKHFRQTPAKSRAVLPIPKSSKGHFVGELVFNRGGQRQRLGFGSLVEHDAALCLIYQPNFLDIEEQLAALPFVLPNGDASRHFFDYRVTNTSLRRTCISVKRECEAKTYEYRAMIAKVKKAAIGNICDDVKTITERNIHPITLHNAKLFHAARDPQPSIDEVVFRELQNISSPVQISEFLERSGIGGDGFRSVARAIRFSYIHQLEKERITGRAFIFNRAAD